MLFIDTEYARDLTGLFHGHPDTATCLLELVLTSLRNLEVNKKAVFDPSLVGEGPNTIDTYFKGQTSDDYLTEYDCNFSLPIKMSDIVEQIKAGGNKLMETFVAQRGENAETAVFTNLSQRFLLVKLYYDDVEVGDDDIQPIWESIEEKFDTGLLTNPPAEEYKASRENAHLVGVVLRLNKDRNINNNETNVLIDGQWRNLKTCVYKSNSYDHIVEDGYTAKRLPILLVYKITDNMPKNAYVPPKKKEEVKKVEPVKPAAAKPPPTSSDLGASSMGSRPASGKCNFGIILFRTA
jgi:hypothetical protein